MSYSLNSLKRGYIRDYARDYYRASLRCILIVQTIAQGLWLMSYGFGCDAGLSGFRVWVFTESEAQEVQF